MFHTGLSADGLHARLMVEYRTTKRIQEQYTAFMEGFNELIPQELINVFDERELELLIGGISESTFSSLYLPSPYQPTYLSLQLTSMTGSSSPTTVGTRQMTRSSSGSGSASAPGPRSASHACCNSSPARVGSPSTGLRTCKDLMGPAGLRLRRAGTRVSCRRAIRALIE